MSRKCEYYKNLIKDDLAGEMSQDSRSELNEHLSSCPECSREKAELSEVFGILGSFEDQPVPGHFFVHEQPRMSFVQMLRSLAPGSRWAAAAVAAVLVFMFGMVILNTHIQYQGNAVMVSFGDTGNSISEQELQSKIVSAIKDGREEDNLVFARILDDQNKVVGASLNRLDQKVDTRFSELEGRVFEAVQSNNRKLEHQIDVSIFQYGEMIKTQHQLDLRRISNRLDQIAMEGRRRETQNGAIMTTLAQYGLSGFRTKGVLYD